MSIRRVCIAIAGSALVLPAFAAPPVTPEQSLNDDLSGPRVAWLGEIIDVVAQGDDTCFILNRVQELDYRYAQTATRFAACSPGGFDEPTYAPGKVLAVEGNLGAAVPRRIGGKDLSIALIAAPRLSAQPDTLASPPAYYGYYGAPYGPYYGPQFDPFYPGYGVWFGFHSHRRHR